MRGSKWFWREYGAAPRRMCLRVSSEALKGKTMAKINVRPTK